MSQYYDYNSYQPVDYTGYTHEQSYLNPDAVASGLVCEPLSSDAQQFYPYFDEDTPRQCADTQDSWVSPIYYDPVSGLYIQTFPPEHDEFLEKYGQRIEVPEPPEPQHGGWIYEEEEHSRARAQSPGFHYYSGHTSTSFDSSEVAMSSPVSDYEAASMLQYIASPPVAAAQPGERGVPRSATWSGDYNARPDVSLAHFRHQSMPVSNVASPQVNPPAAPPTFQPALDDLLQPQPHMIVPSQQALGAFLEGRRESAAELTQKTFAAAPRMITDFPHPDTFAASPAELVQREVATAAPSLLYSVHDLHVLDNDEAPSPTASYETDEYSPSGSHQSHSPARSLSPKGKKRAISRSWSPRLKSTSPKRSALRLSPAPASKKSAPEKKQTLACLFCRGRKIACGPPLLGSPDRTCNQCARRCLKCEYPTESRRGMRRRKKTVPKVVSQRMS